MKPLEDAGEFCAGFHDAYFRNVNDQRVQRDENWPFTYAKERNVGAAKSALDGVGDT